MVLHTKDLHLLSEMYWRQSASIRTEGKFSRWIMMVKSARQGCVNLQIFSTGVQKKKLSHVEDLEGISVGERNLNNVVCR